MNNNFVDNSYDWYQKKSQVNIDDLKKNNLDFLENKTSLIKTNLFTYFLLNDYKKFLKKEFCFLVINLLFNLAEIIFFILWIFNVNLTFYIIPNDLNSIVNLKSWILFVIIFCLNLMNSIYLLFIQKNKLNLLLFLRKFFIYLFSIVGIFWWVYNFYNEFKIIKNQINHFKNDLQINSKTKIYYLLLVGISISIFLLLKLVFSFWKIFGGWSIEVDLMFYLLVLVMIDKFKYVCLFVILAPLLSIPFSSGFINLLQVFVEYFLSYWILLPMCLFYNFNCKILKKIKTLKKTTKNIISLSIFFIFSLGLICLKMFVHIIAGVIWWTNGDWLFSIILNAQILLGSFAICLPFTLISLMPILVLRKENLNHNLTYLVKADN